MILFNQSDFSDSPNRTTSSMNQLVSTALLLGNKQNRKRLTNQTGPAAPSSMPTLPLKSAKN